MGVTNFDIIECDELITDNVVLGAGSVGTTEIADSAITNVKMADDAVKKAELDYEVASVTVTAGQTAGTATVVAGGQILGIYPTGNQDQFVDNVAISTTTLTVTLAAAATADNTFNVVILKA